MPRFAGAYAWSAFFSSVAWAAFVLLPSTFTLKRSLALPAI
jgi:hypothetical protein